MQGFEVPGYLGTRYEIARLDHSFERDLSRITATYSLWENGGVEVANRSFDSRKRESQEVTGRVYFVEGSDIGRPKVSFFRPFYSG